MSTDDDIYGWTPPPQVADEPYDPVYGWPPEKAPLQAHLIPLQHLTRVHYNAEGTIIGVEQTNAPSVIEGHNYLDLPHATAVSHRTHKVDHARRRIVELPTEERAKHFRKWTE